MPHNQCEDTKMGKWLPISDFSEIMNLNSFSCSMCLVVASFIFHRNQIKHKGTNNDVKLIQVTLPQLK